MKKNSTMRIAAVLMVLTLMTSCFVGGTFAKYTTGDDGSDNARVARWGVTVGATVDMFADAYKDEEAVWVDPDIDNTVTVRANTQGHNLVAPGTNGTMAEFTVSGTPEVDVEVTYTGALTLTGWFLDANKNGTQDVGETDYCPLIITINGNDYCIGKDGIDSVVGLQNKVNEVINGYTNTYQTLTDLSAVNDDLKISWRWEYNGGDHLALGYQTDERDTLLGDMVAGAVAPTINFAISCTITQVD